ncbi:hydroxyacid dehydrogenase [Phytoactinopolyspora alkaliphila]|uniref:Hydroxyacid dehydrogenase n=1 Tax=Phytoactinopolyspora alkaliphila TaxID=1783498 RepID=A0A6N9YH47_9ACTN|nr:hydroxyacid dehydrogenase [Phytoactinopolyspora alkaliphila]NED94272.1 hydroxyacid dehydrogenase [Phytoactinopolyspora alkaliphila]
MRHRPVALVAMNEHMARRILTTPVRERLADLVNVDSHMVASDFHATRVRQALADAEVLLTSWGCPPLTEDVLARAPRLRAIVHAAGTVKPHVTDACWKRGIRVSSAASANAVPVAEYTVAAVLFSNKRVFEIAADYLVEASWMYWGERFPSVGNYRKTIGVVGASRVGRRVIELLQAFDLRLLLADPYVDEVEARTLGVQLCEIDDLVSHSDVVTLHAPALPETRHLLDAARLARMRDDTTVINTARPSLIDQQALTKELLSGRLRAVLDVTEPEPLPADSVLFNLPNVLITPHIAGSIGGELARMAECALDELERYAGGLPFRHGVEPQDLSRSA